MKQASQVAHKEIDYVLTNKGWSYLWLSHYIDFILEENDRAYKVFWATISTEKGAVFDAWIILGDGLTDVCNFDTFPTIKGAVAYHIGQLVMNGFLSIELIPDEDKPKEDKTILP